MKLKTIILLSVAVISIPLSSKAVITNCYDFFGSLQCDSQLDPVEQQEQFFQDQRQQIRDWEYRQRQAELDRQLLQQRENLLREQVGQNLYNSIQKANPVNIETPDASCKRNFGQYSYSAGTTSDGKNQCECLPGSEFKNPYCVLKSSIPTPAPSFGSGGGGGGYTIPEGALIRAIGDIDVYIVKYVGSKKFKRLVLSPSVFNNYGHLKWENILDIDRSTVDSFTTSDLVRAADDNRVYRLYPSGDAGQKRMIGNNNVLAKYGLDSDSIYEINSYDRDSYVVGSVLE